MVKQAKPPITALPGMAYTTKHCKRIKKMAEAKQAARREGKESFRIMSMFRTLLTTHLKAIVCVELQSRQKKRHGLPAITKKPPKNLIDFLCWKPFFLKYLAFVGNPVLLQNSITCAFYTTSFQKLN
jgi:hypothetical protein